MKDPFPWQPLPWLSEKTQPWADYFDLPTLPLHIHEVLAAALLYSVIFWPISPWISNLLAPEHYSKLPRKRRLNWDAHVVSMVQSCLINTLAIWVMFVDTEMSNMEWEERIWGYTGGAGFIQALAAGYFLWDLVVTSINLDVFGLGTLAHAVAALLVYSLGFRPFLNHYACVFILWELSTPFLNVHWFMDKLNMTGTRAQLYNGIMLLFTFFSCRLIYGSYSSFRVYRDVWSAINVNPDMKALNLPTMSFAHPDSTVPMWIGVAYLASNITLNSLNFYWFFMMIRAVRKRFVPAAESEEKVQESPVTEAEIDLSSVATGLSKPSGGRRRKA
ncbi:TLC domain-containing protein [Fusarium redolens]|uniref:TLC domain-containing protein n=1 Tax=Fusarium redolens TaxID=48865 RepID=A0A9P9R977_FUSRE|nr:TLC domain-containing protein [Fusarium redolens]KAH7270487.1 TLC domain-containing protein [Fusarium redolens]